MLTFSGLPPSQLNASFGFAQQFEIDMACTVQTDFFLNRPKKCERRMRQFVAQDGQGGRTKSSRRRHDRRRHRPVLGSAERTKSPSICGWLPKQIGTVSMWAISKRRGARDCAGQFENQIADLAGDGRAAVGSIEDDVGFACPGVREAVP